jgi:uroporphyrinogen decarboxylase
MPLSLISVTDTAKLARQGGREFQDEHHGPIMSWDDFEKYPWPDPAASSDRSLAWYEENLPDDMCLIGHAPGHFAEYLTFLMSYETLCFALYDNRDLVAAIADKLREIFCEVTRRLVQYNRVKAIQASDDMGFKTGTLISPDDLREFVLSGHKTLAEMAHEAGRPYLLHSCGNLREIMPDLLDDVKIDAKHSFEDTIELVTDAKADYGDRITLLGGIDVDFLCRADEQAIRKRVRETLDVCMPGGGYCLGTGNSVANYIPLDNYLTMLDEGRRYGV